MAETRRRFLQNAAMVAAGAAVRPGARTEAAGQASASPQTVGDVFTRGVIVDDLGGFMPNPKLPNDGWDALAASGLTICTAGVGSVVPHESVESTIGGLARLAATVARHADRLVQVRTFGDIERARRDKRLALIPNVQNSTCDRLRDQEPRSLLRLGPAPDSADVQLAELGGRRLHRAHPSRPELLRRRLGAADERARDDRRRRAHRVPVDA